MQESLFYNKHHYYWKVYQEHFPEHMRINDSNFPDEEYWQWNNHHIHIDRYQKTKNTQAVKVIILHGGGGNGRVLSPIGIALQNYGYQSLIPDFPGFGLSKPSKEPVNYNEWVSIATHLVEEEYRKDKIPIVLVGISLGGMLCYQVACKSNKVVGIIASALADARLPHVQETLARFAFQAKLGKLFFKHHSYIDSLKVPLKAFSKMHMVSNDKVLIEKMLNDKIGSGTWVHLSFFRTLFQSELAIEPEQFTNCPVLLVHPEKDRMIPVEISLPFFNKIKAEKKMVLLQNAGHIPIEQPGIDQLERESIQFIRPLALVTKRY